MINLFKFVSGIYLFLLALCCIIKASFIDARTRKPSAIASAIAGEGGSIVCFLHPSLGVCTGLIRFERLAEVFSVVHFPLQIFKFNNVGIDFSIC